MKNLKGTMVAAIVVMASVTGGCGGGTDIRPDDIRRYTVPRVEAPERNASPGLAAGTMQPRGGDTPQLRLRYEVPEGWSDRGASGMRLATLAIGDPADGREVTVIPAAGTLESNVERWQGQLDAAATPAARAEAVERAVSQAQRIDVAGTQAAVVLLHGPAGPDDDGGEVILGAMIPIDDTASLFVKYKGDAAVAGRERENFNRFVQSIRWK